MALSKLITHVLTLTDNISHHAGALLETVVPVVPAVDL